MVRHETTLFNNRPERIKHFILNSRNYITNFIQQNIYIYIYIYIDIYMGSVNRYS